MISRKALFIMADRSENRSTDLLDSSSLQRDLSHMSFNWSAVCSDDVGASKRSKMSHTPSTPNSGHNSVPGSSSSSTITTWDIDAGLAADFDGSLSGLGSELGSAPYNMSEALLALPVFKQENLDNGFQYILGAATSPAVKMNEETLTYLNQGQSYEIKVKKLGDLSDFQGKVLRSVIRVSFHDRRLQYMERQHLEQWKTTRPGERILEIDVPLSYGIVDYSMSPLTLNAAEYIWDPTKETGVYVKVHCISTEFTPKKHGGEKGVPFRIQIETYTYEDEQPSKMLHCASCQVKVFKPKGADRKHKTDREKMDKRSEAEKEKFQPSYECTVLTEIPLEQAIQMQNNYLNALQNTFGNGSGPQPIKKDPGNSMKEEPPDASNWSWRSNNQSTQPPVSETKSVSPISPQPMSEPPSPGICMVNPVWSDILRLSRDDLIQICGLADGIRLNNALHNRPIQPRLTLYVCQEPGAMYHALYLESLCRDELLSQIAQLFQVPQEGIKDIFVEGPSSIQVVLTDESCNKSDPINVESNLLWDPLESNLLWDPLESYLQWHPLESNLLWHPLVSNLLWDPLESNLLWDPLESNLLWDPLESNLLWDPLESNLLWDPLESNLLWHPLESYLQWHPLESNLQWDPLESNLLWHPLESNLQWHPLESNLLWDPLESNLLWDPLESNLLWDPLESNLLWDPLESYLQWHPLESNLLWDPL
ncbi:hypothetical protein ACJMK2_022512 [Sinanodonta woodiana]|uniref:Grh/CP2 DB domain-containing protein n=1 Tax=Sinanodonta woodiana TaxID=1069815 RepID=A0ABD3TJD6_SINWO